MKTGTQREIKRFNNLNQIPKNYVMAEERGKIEGFPWVMVQFLLPSGCTMLVPVHENIVANLEKVAIDDM